MRKSLLSLHRSQRGSILLAVLFGTILLSTLAIGMLDWSLNTLRDAKRKQLRQRVAVQANNEMEFLFYHWSDKIAAPSPASITTRLANTNFSRTVGSTSVMAPVSVTGESDLLSSTQPKFLYTDEEEADPGASGVDAIERARRIANRQDRGVVVGRHLTDIGLSAVGTYEDSVSSLRKKASVSYYRARVRVTQTDPQLGTVEVRLGRRFVFLRATPFTRAVFYESNMEFGVGSNLDISGDIQANGSIYMGSQSGVALRISGDVYYYDKYNGHINPSLGSRHVYNGPSTDDSVADTWIDPIFDPNLSDVSYPEQSAQRVQQVKKLAGKETFVTTSETSPAEIYNSYATASPPPYENVNDVYRAVIAPPPMNSGTLIPEDQMVRESRMYNKASIIIAVADNDEGTVSVMDSDGNSLSTLVGAVTSVRSEIVDLRENTYTQITTLDVSELKARIEGSADIQAKYNGVVYFYDKRAQTDSTKDYAVRLTNATEVPNFNDLGFVVASDNPVYLQGSFNTVMPTGASELPRCAIMGDAITLLSEGWDDAKSTNHLIPLENIDGVDVIEPNPRTATADMVINSALVSGITPTVSSSQKSGGVQNLVRYMEDWTGRSSTVNGSLGQMYSSKYFNSYMKNGSTLPAVGASIARVRTYTQPSFRYLNFDQRLAERPPSGTPSSRLGYYRGDMFNW